MRQFYCKMQQLLQNAMILSQNATVIIKCNHNTNFDLSTQEKVRCRPKINTPDKIYRTHNE